MGSSGYRLIPGNTCTKSNGVEKDAKVEKECSQAQPAEGEITHQIVCTVSFTQLNIRFIDERVFLSNEPSLNFHLKLCNILTSKSQRCVVPCFKNLIAQCIPRQSSFVYKTVQSGNPATKVIHGLSRFRVTSSSCFISTPTLMIEHTFLLRPKCSFTRLILGAPGIISRDQLPPIPLVHRFCIFTQLHLTHSSGLETKIARIMAKIVMPLLIILSKMGAIGMLLKLTFVIVHGLEMKS